MPRFAVAVNFRKSGQSVFARLYIVALLHKTYGKGAAYAGFIFYQKYLAHIWVLLQIFGFPIIYIAIGLPAIFDRR
jgi:hypothetical protein